MANNELNIAIIGMSGEFPGANNIKELWSNLINGGESIHTFTPDELRSMGVSEAEFTKENYVPRAGILKDVELFDASFFGYSPREAMLIDPQQRKLLEHAWLACEDAAINPLIFPGAMGVFVGSSLNTYLLNNILNQPGIDEADDIQQILFGNGLDYLATRIAYQLNCRGPALNIQTACSTSLVAIHEACQHLLTYQADVAIAGGVSINTPPKGYLYSVDGMMSPDGQCNPFSTEAQGTVFSSGLGVVVLKRLEDAIQDGNPIYAVIRGSAINNDGHGKVGYTAPSIDGQAEVILLAQANAAVSTEQVCYIETHGTGTQLGDPIELAALQQVFAEGTSNKQFCAIGSIKSNIGHLDVAAGVAGLIKTTLALSHQEIPPTLYRGSPTNKFDWKNSAFYLNNKSTKLSTNEPAVAAVSCFGIGGTNAHVILQEYVQTELKSLQPSSTLLVFSAKTQQALQTVLKNFADEICNRSRVDMPAIARTLQVGRAPFRYRAAFVVNSIEQAVMVIQQEEYSIIACEHVRNVLPVKPVESCNQEDLQKIADQWLAGYEIDWDLHYENHKPTMVHLPGYPFERQRFWLEPYQSHQAEKKMPIDEWFYQPSWKPNPLSSSFSPMTGGAVLVFLDKKTQSIINWGYLETFGKVIMVFAAEKFAVLDESTCQINITDPDDFKKLFQHLLQTQRLPNYVVHGLTLTLNKEASTIDTFHNHQPYGLLSCIYLIQAWEKIVQDRPLKLTVITNRLTSIAEAIHEPHKVPVLAAVKVIPKEYLNAETQLIDMDCVDHPQFAEYQMQQIVQEMGKPHYDEEEIVLRGITRWLRTYVKTPIHAVSKKPFAVGTEQVIMITGGLGQLGLDIASYFAQFPGIKLALIARREFPPQSEWAALIEQYEEDHPRRIILQRLQSMHQRGCIVQTFSADVSDKTSLEKAIAAIESSLGGITGVIHAAGETVNGIIALKRPESLTESYQAKVFGTYHLCEIFTKKSLKFMILCSSMNAIIGGLGQLDNTAANTVVDSLAEYYAMQTGQPILSINWGAINIDRPLKVNVVPQFADLSTEHKRNRMNDEETHEVYNRLLSHQFGARLLISTISMDDVLKNWNRVASIQDLAKDIDMGTNKHCELRPEEQPETPIEIWIAEQWSRLLGVNVIGKQHNFFTLGGHSLSSVQFMTKLLEQYQVKAHVMNLYEMPTLSEFSNYIEKLLQQKQVVKSEK